jgi:sugar phosphate isomerase/epimerase
MQLRTAIGRPGLAVFALLLQMLVSPSARPQADIPQRYLVNGFALGCQANTFSRFTVTEAIEKTAQAGGKIIEFYPDQKLSPERPDVLWNHMASEQVMAQVRAKLAQAGIRAVAYGAVSIPNDEAAARRIFEFARKMEMRALITESVESIDLLERLAQEYNVAVAYHHHPRRPNDPNYRLWDPNYIAALVKDRDRRIGACADTGNWTRSGVRPLEGLRILKGRIFCVHLKDMTAFGRRDAHEVPFGSGASDIRGCLEELKIQGFRGDIAVEYEYNPADNLADVNRCIEFVRNLGR